MRSLSLTKSLPGFRVKRVAKRKRKGNRVGKKKTIRIKKRRGRRGKKRRK